MTWSTRSPSHRLIGRVPLELSVIKSQLDAVEGCVRWIPHELNAADALTKLHGHAQPLLDLMSTAQMTVCDEQQVLQQRQQWREDNQQRQNPRPKHRGPTAGPLQLENQRVSPPCEPSEADAFSRETFTV